MEHVDEPSKSDGTGPTRLVRGGRVEVSPMFFVCMGAAVAFQIGTTSAGVAGAGQHPGRLILAGTAAFLLVSIGLLAHLRQRYGTRLAGLAGRVIGGTASAAATSYTLGFGAAVWAALAGVWWLVVLCSATGGTAYAVSGLTYLRRHRSEPATHAPTIPAALWWGAAALASAGLVLIVLLA